VLVGTRALDDRVRSILVESLYAQPSSLAIGALCGIANAQVAAYVSQSLPITLIAWTVTLIAIVRIVLAYRLPSSHAGRTRYLEIAWEFGAYSYAIALGMLATICVYVGADHTVEVMTVVNAVGYATGIAARNAGRPLIAIGQLVLTLVPLIAALATRAEPAMLTLGLTIFLLIPAMMLISLKVFGILRDSISAAETSARLADKMQHLARTDVVTGLLNRAGLNHFLAERVSQVCKGHELALFWLDLDRFKEVNDALGHQTGDMVLGEIAQRLREQAPNDAVIGRFGGDEFILASEVTGHREAELIAQAVLDAIARPIPIEGEKLEVGCSMGIALHPHDGSDVESLMRGADLALYHSKVNGRKQVNFFDPSMTRNLVRRREIEAELRLALQRDELSIFFQPIVDLATGRIKAFEALVRWFHPEKGELRPDEFIPVAEETGAIITLGNWITAQAARAAAQWPDDVTVAVNLSPLQLKAPGAALGILSALREAKLPPHRLELEITETVLLDDSENTGNFMRELGASGVRFALDDFGTGYSSLGYLNKYPFGKIKIDRSFVSGVAAGEKSDAIIRAVSEMASTFGMQIVAEGIETVEQVELVRRAGCTQGQGYYFSRAVPDYLAGMLLAQEREKLSLLRKAG
jgi:diguanylate cyclase (GGDEF)-like protein